MPPKLGGGGEKCHRCTKTVYAAEKISAASMVRSSALKIYFWLLIPNINFSYLNEKDYHKACFKCKTCNTNLNLNTYKDYEKDIFCKGCFGDKLQPYAQNRKELEQSHTHWE